MILQQTFAVERLEATETNAWHSSSAEYQSNVRASRQPIHQRRATESGVS